MVNRFELLRMFQRTLSWNNYTTTPVTVQVFKIDCHFRARGNFKVCIRVHVIQEWRHCPRKWRSIVMFYIYIIFLSLSATLILRYFVKEAQYSPRNWRWEPFSWEQFIRELVWNKEELPCPLSENANQRNKKVKRRHFTCNAMWN